MKIKGLQKSSPTYGTREDHFLLQKKLFHIPDADFAWSGNYEFSYNLEGFYSRRFHSETVLDIKIKLIMVL